MSSWTLLRTIMAWDAPVSRTPIFERERGQPLLWQQQRQVFARIPFFRLAVLTLALLILLRLADLPLATRCLNALLLVLVPPALLFLSLVLWTVPLGLVLAPIVVRERVAGTWDILRVTPYSAEELLTSKVAGALARLRGLFLSVGGLQAQILAAIVLGMGLMEVIGGVGRLPSGDVTLEQQSVLCVGGILLVVAAVAVFLFDRIQLFIMMVVGVLAAGAASSSTHLMLARAVGTAFAIWLLDVGVAVVILLLQPAGQAPALGYRVAAAVMIGPPASYALTMPPARTALLLALTLAARELAVRRLWRLAVARASDC